MMKVIFAVLISAFLFQQNNPPLVKLTVTNGLTVAPNSVVRYAISISDKEDGETKYDEITSNEILLSATSPSDTGSVNRLVLHSMMASNCMNCHAFTTKLIGPSFTDISKRYASSP